jgi:mRNA deadenylase 3'-5' endonuclease subunit Ccr4
MSKDNIAQVLVFEVLPRSTRTRLSSNHLCVVNTHLYSNHMRPEIKLWQTYTLLREIEDFILNQDLALIICGDFNSEPESAVYEYISTGSCNESFNSLIDEVCKSVGNIDQFMHNIDIISAMSSSFGFEPEFTNYTKLFKGTLDYIWFTPGRLKILAVTDLPTEADISEFGEALPSVSFPSDHLMLCCDVALLSSGTSIRNPHAMPRGSNRGNGSINRGMSGLSHGGNNNSSGSSGNIQQHGGSSNSSGNLNGLRSQSASPGIKMGINNKQNTGSNGRR